MSCLAQGQVFYDVGEGGIFGRKILLKNIGDENDGHTHNYHHVMVAILGELEVHFDDGRPSVIMIPGGPDLPVHKGVRHRTVARKPMSMFGCYFGHRNKDGEVVNEAEGTFEERFENYR